MNRSITCPPLHNCEANRIEITTSNRSTIVLWLSIASETFVNFIAMAWFPSVYNFLFSYPWKTCSVTSCFPRISFFAATYLPICFQEMAHMSQYHAVVEYATFLRTRTLLSFTMHLVEWLTCFLIPSK